MTNFFGTTPLRYLIPRVFLIGLLLLSYQVLTPFFISVIWAFIIAYITWLPYCKLRQQLNGNSTLSAALMTGLITMVILLALFWLVSSLQQDIKAAYQTLVNTFNQRVFRLPELITRLPWLAHYLQPWLEQLNNDRTGLITSLVTYGKQWLGQFAQFLGGIGGSLMKLGVVLVTVFFCFRDGEAALLQLRSGVINFLGDAQNVYLQAVGDTTRAVVYGLVLAAMGQGFLAGLGYLVAGVQAPMLLGVMTALLALIPMGAMLVWLPISLFLMLSGQFITGMGLLLWGFFAVSTVDNIIRPIVISGTSKVPFLVVLFGVFGGLMAFGAVGLFLGPVILSVLLSVWQAWLKLQPPPAPVNTAPDAADNYRLTAEQVLTQLGVNVAQGLSQTEADTRLQRDGRNRLAEKPPRPAWHLLLSQFKSLLILVLIVGAVLAAVIGDIKDGIVIMVVVLINALLGFYQEHQAEKSLAALKKMLALTTKVRRAGAVLELAAEQLVVGDIVLLEAGNKIPADGRIIIAHTLEVDESSLTGESMPVAKQHTALNNQALPLAERNTMLYMNTAITRGRAEMVVTATGMNTEIGKLATLLAQTEDSNTPLQDELDSVGKRLALLALAVVVLLFGSALWRGEPLMQTALTAIALAVAAIPEGLPAVVTVTLALGMHRMAQQRAIVKRLAAVETLGCVSVICTDKTGTLTVNQMTARALFYRGQRYHVSGEGYHLGGDITPVETKQSPANLTDLLLPLALCNDSQWQDDKIVGDPMEAALLVLAAKGGLTKQQANMQLPRLAEIPFDAEHKFMATFHQDDDGITIFIKGAPEVLLNACDFMQDGQGNPVAIEQATITQHNAALAQTGLRVLGVAITHIKTPLTAEAKAALLTGDLFQHIHALTFVALIGLLDPPRAEVGAAIKLCQQAGIAVKMITGDQKITAAAIAQELGLTGDIMTGTELAALDDRTLAACINSIAVFARTAPEQKVRIISALKLDGQIVAMTGDGVNDAPALKTADIGIAMGRSGTDVAQEAAAMILTDDNFATIVTAVKEGRGIYENMIKFIRFQLSTNIGAILTVTFAPIFAMPVPFTAVQLLWLNIIMDGPPALSLGVDPASTHSMNEAPRDPDSRILSWQRFGNLFSYGLTMAIVVLGTESVPTSEAPDTDFKPEVT